MKRFFATVLALVSLLSLGSCSSSLETGEVKTAEEVKESVEKTPEKEAETGPFVPPEGFSVGYARLDMTPSNFPILSYDDGYANGAHDPIQMTCVAVSDGETTALLITLDLRNMGVTLATRCREIISKNVGIPVENIYMNSSHTHSSVDCNFDEDSVTIWKTKFYKLLPQMAEQAIRDLTPADAYVGASHTEGLTFVRRYIGEDGSFNGIGDAATSVNLRHESEADSEMRVIRFDRAGDAKDVVMVNYQTHYGGATSLWPEKLSADFVHFLRQSAEKELNCHFSYFNGGSGNLAFNTKLEGELKYPTFVDAIPHMMDVVKDAIKGEEKVQTGKVRVENNDFVTESRKFDEDTVAKAKQVVDAGKDTQVQKDLILQYGFRSRYEAAAICRTAAMADQTAVNFGAVSFGDIALAFAPYEMFDANAKEIREASPFQMTFVCGYTNGDYSYVPAAYAWENGGYEVFSCRFPEGCGEVFANEILRLLNACKAQG
ncbi:MAG: hypothetical protein E7580_04325 [Ruminococcaceae bacterium]|nr:hypothetical protein [Oscillospiraceae bacterium]